MACHSPPEQPLLLTAQQVADLLGCSPRHVQRMSDRGELPRPIRIGTLVRWTRREIESHIAQATTPREGQR
jgi:excisionase family DNA binding protein